jgi:hypothetical protein
MSLEHEITKRASDGDLSVPELREFLAELDKAGAGDATVNESGLKVRVRSGLKGQVKSITVKIPGGAEQS